MWVLLQISSLTREKELQNKAGATSILRPEGLGL